MQAKVTAMTIKNKEPNKSGSIVKAFFNAHTADIGFKGCALVQKHDGEWSVWTPKLDGRTAAERRADPKSVYWRAGSKIELAILDAAVAAYHALGGDDGLQAEDDYGTLGEELAEEIA